MITGEEVYKFPHDIVHASLHGEPEGTVKLRGFTPDICIPTSDGRYDILEITTTESGKMSSIREKIELKLSKYAPLTKGLNPPVRAINILVVSLDSAWDLSGEIPEGKFKRTIIDAYKFGYSTLFNLTNVTGVRRTGEDKVDEKSLKESFSSFHFRDDLSISKEYFTNKIIDHPKRWQLSKKTYLKEFITFDDYEKKMRDRGPDVMNRSTGMKTIVHLPMVIPEDRGFKIPATAEMSELDNPYSKIFNMCLSRGLFEKPSQSFEVLRMLSEMNPGKHRQPVEGPDMLWMSFDDEEKIDLAERGLLALKEKLINTDVIKERRLNSKLDINYDEDLSAIDEYTSKKIVFDQTCPIDFKEVSHCYDDEVMFKKEALLSKMMTSREYKALHFLNNVFLEINLNLVRAPKDDKRGRQFVYKMIRGYQAFVVIRNSGPNSLDQSHMFYCIFYRGSELELETFEPVRELDNGWKYTEFLSTDQQRLSQMQNIDFRMCGLWASLLDDMADPETGVGDGLSSEISTEHLNKFSECLKIHLLVLLEDKQVTSECLQSFRFYYMKMNTGFKNSWAESMRVTSRFPEMIRSPVLLWLLKRLFEIHKASESKQKELVEEEKVQVNPISWADVEEEIDKEYDDEEEDFKIDFDEAHFKITKGMETPFGFRINSPADLVRAMYVGYMHNKDEGFSGHTVAKMMEKTLRQAYKFRDYRLKTREEKEEFCGQNNLNFDEFREYQHSRPAVMEGCKLLKIRLLKRVGLKYEDWDDYSSNKILSYVLRSNLSEFATTKASTIPFSDLRVDDMNGNEIKEIGQRRKCIEQMLKIWPEFKSNKMALNVESIWSKFESEENGCLKVTLFPKNQIGGSREIFVLTMRGRLLIKVFSDLFRAICEEHPSEVLTKPENKSTMVGEHFGMRRGLKGRYKCTYKVSMDKKTWAQLFSLYGFADMCRGLLPSFLLPFCQVILSAHKSKELQIPTSLIKQFLRNSQNKLSSESVNRLKEEFVGKRDPCLLSNYHRAIYRNEVDMMQGILHYPSSCYHLLISEYQSLMVEKWLSQNGCDCLIDFRVSSDDEGDLISFSSDDKDHLKRIMGRFHNAFPHIVKTADLAFGTETSGEKTSCTYLEIFELNSEFYFGNTCQRAQSKFDNNSLFDEPNESLHLRIASLYAKLREMRVNGASGALCSFYSLLQCLCFTRDLGMWSADWYESGVYKKLTNSLTTYSGYYFIFNELKAGLMDTTYVNWLASKKGGIEVDRILYFLGMYSLPLTPEDRIKYKFSVGSKRKYFNFLKRVGLDPGNHDDMSEEQFRVLMVGAETVEEEKMVVEFGALNPNLSRSMQFLNRTHATRMASYVLWSAMYSNHDRTKYFSLSSLLEESKKNDKLDDEISKSTLFPMSEQFQRIKDLDSASHSVSGILSYRRLYPCFVSPQYQSSEHIKNMKSVMSSIWFSKKGRLSMTQTNNYYDELKEDLPWLERTLGDTIKKMPFADLGQLYSFLQSSSSIVTAFSALVRGRPKKSFSSIQALLSNNVFSRRRVFTSYDSIRSTNYPNMDLASILDSQRLCDRLRSWKDLLDSSRDDQFGLLEDFNEDIKWMSTKLSKTQMTTQDAGTEEEYVCKFMGLVSKRLSLSQYVALCKECTVYLIPQTRMRNVFTGDYDAIIKDRDAVVRTRIINKTTYVETNISEIEFRRRFRSTYDHFKQSVVRIPEFFYDSCVFEKGNLLVKLVSENKDFAYVDLPKVHNRTIHMLRDSHEGTLLETWLSRSEPDRKMKFDFLRMCLYTNKEGFISQTALRLVKQNEKRARVTKLSERIEVSSVKPEEDINKLKTDDLIDLLADVFEEPELEDFFDLFDEYVDDAEGDIGGAVLGMESSALESYISSLQSNRVLLELTKMIKSLKSVGDFAWNEETMKAMKYYDSIKV